MSRKKLHIIAPYPFGEAPSQRFRFEQYIDFWEQNGFDVHYHAFHTHKSWERLYHKGKFVQKSFDLMFNFCRRWILLVQLIPVKHLFIHREMAHIGPPIFEWILAKVMRKKYHFDFDDAIWIPNYSAANARFQRMKCFWKTKYLIRWAAHVSAGNAYLQTYALQYNAQVERIPTTIDTEKQHCLLTNQSSTKVVIGWTGTHSTMRYLAPIFPVLERLAAEFTFEFHLISNEAPEKSYPFLIYKPWCLETEMSDLAQFQIGLMPLEEDRWTNGKCGFKALQYMAIGSVAVVSPIGVNTTIVQHGENGFFATSETEWENTLRTLLQQPELRSEIGKKARNTILQKWSVGAWKMYYLKLFDTKKATP